MDDVRIRSATPSDAASIDAAQAAFGAHAAKVVPLVHELRRTGAAVHELVAEAAGEVVGHVLLSRGWLDAPQRLVVVHVLSPLAVLPHRQGQGIGRALVRQAVGASDAAQAPAVFLEGDPAYYSRAGFLAAAPEGFRAPSVRIPGPAFQVRLLAAHEPWMTGTLVLPDAFWSLDAVGLR